jgi:hypothetical protein
MPSDVTEADVQELTDHLSDYLERVEEGETILTRGEGKLFGRLGPVRAEEARQEDDVSTREKMKALEEKGVLSWSGKKPPAREPVAKVKGEKTVAQLLLEDRR